MVAATVTLCDARILLRAVQQVKVMQRIGTSLGVAR